MKNSRKGADLDTFAAAYDAGFRYDLDNRLILHWYPRRIAKKMVPGSLLELGLGHGYSSREFARIASDYVVLDGSSAVISAFRERNPDLGNIEIEHTYFEDYETDRAFDNIIMGFVLEHVTDPESLVNRYKRYLSSRGKMFIAVPNSESLHRRIGHLAGLLPDMGTLSSFDRQLGHRRYFDLGLLREMVARCGLSILSEEGLFLKPLTTQQLEALDLDEDIFRSLLELGKDYPELSAGILMELRLG